MNIKLNDFFDILTYDGLLDYVDLPSHIAAGCVEEDPEHKQVFVEPLSPTLVRCWYPIDSWIKEFKRRKECDAILADCSRLHTNVPPKDSIADLQKMIIRAANEKNFEEVVKLGERLKLITK